MPVFNKCDAIRIHWIMYDDNNLLYYDKRPLKERFNHSLPNNKLNIYHKSIVRGKDYNTTVFVPGSASHEPNHNITSQCDALGNIERLAPGRMYSPKYKYCFMGNSHDKKLIMSLVRSLPSNKMKNKFAR